MTTLIEPLRIATSRDAGDGTCDESGELRGRRAGGAPAAAAEHGTDGPAAGRRPPRRSPRDGAGSRGCTPPASARRGSLGSPLASRVPSDAALVRGFAWAASTPPPRPPVSCALWCAVAAKPNGAIPIVASSLPFGCGSAFSVRGARSVYAKKSILARQSASAPSDRDNTAGSGASYDLRGVVRLRSGFRPDTQDAGACELRSVLRGGSGPRRTEICPARDACGPVTCFRFFCRAVCERCFTACCLKHCRKRCANSPFAFPCRADPRRDARSDEF